jgi:two-component system chemotaxis response regulator CheY
MVGIRQTLKNILKDLGYANVTSVENGQLGWDLILKALESSQRFDLILSDWNMPVMTGIDLLKKVRSYPDIATTPFLLVTAEGEFANVKSALEWKVSAYVVKPFAPAAIKAKLEMAWKQSEALKKKAAAA